MAQEMARREGPALRVTSLGRLRRVYVWEVPVRLTHWVNVLSIVVLSVTGFYIGNPVIVVGGEAYNHFFMGTVRYIHFLFAFIFVASLLLRTYWAFAGNRWASWRGLFPFLTAEGRRQMKEVFLYYTFLRRRPPIAVGHNALAGFTYLFIVLLYFLQVLTGFALYGQANVGGVWWSLTSWLFRWFTPQGIRLLHHMIMWLLLGFAVHHVYSAFLMDAEEGNGTISSIFSGFKFLPEEEVEG